MRELTDKVVVVTGAGSGIGRETALAFAKKGCPLALCDIDVATMDETAKLVIDGGGQATTHRVDVADSAQVAAFADEVVRAHGAVHVLINNAGVTIMSSFEEHSLEDIDWIFGVNLWGVVYCCKAFLPHLVRAGEGHIVNLSSVFGIIAPPLQTTYCATKFAVRGFSESLRAELAEKNIGVTSVHPGTIQTNIVRDARIQSSAGGEDMRSRTMRTFDRWGTSPTVVANRIVRAVEHNSPRVLVTGEARLADALKRLMPATTDGLVARMTKRISG